MSEHHDEPFDHLIRRTLASSTSDQSGRDCLDAETLAAWTDRSLPRDAEARVVSHLADCSRCRAVLAALVRTEPATPAPIPLWRSWRLPVLVPLATAVTVAVLVWPDGSTPPPRTPQAAPAEQASDARVAGPATPLEEPARRSDLAAGPEETVAEDRDSQQPPQRAEREAESPAAGRAVSDQPSLPRVAERAAPLDARNAADAAAKPEAAATAVGLAARLPGELLEAAPGDVLAACRIVAGRRVEVSPGGAERPTPVELDSPGLLTAVAIPSASVCWVVGESGAVYLSTDGMRFRRLPFPERVDLREVRAADDRQATVTAVDGRSWTTLDQGLSWSR